MPHELASLPFNRAYASAGSSTIGTYMAAASLAQAALAGMYAGPIRIPLRVNRAQPTRLFIDTAPSANTAASGTGIRYNWNYTVQSPGNVRREASFAFTWAVPNPWNTTDLSRILLDDGTGYSFPANFFEPGDVLGIRVARDGPHAADTFPITSYLAQVVSLDYLQLYPWLDSYM